MCDERQRNEFRETPGALLQVPQPLQVDGLMAVFIDVTEHDGRRRAQPHVMRGLDDLQPPAGVELVGAENPAHVVGQDFRSRPGKAAESLRAQQRRFYEPDFPGLLSLIMFVTV